MTDADFVLAQLERGPRDAMQIISASLRDREVGLTVHSRVADLRRDGLQDHVPDRGKNRKGRERYVYRLQNAGRVEPPAVEHVARGAEIPAPVLDVNPDHSPSSHDAPHGLTRASPLPGSRAPAANWSAATG